MLSLNARLNISAGVVLAGFLGLAGLALDRAFAESALAGVRDRLQNRIYALITAAELNGDALIMPDALPEPRLSQPQSGIYARVADEAGRTLWRSRSSLGLDILYPAPGPPGVAAFSDTHADEVPLFSIAYAAHWAPAKGPELRFVFQAAEDRKPYEDEIARFRGALWGWLAGAAVILLAVQGLVLRWSLAPLRRVTREIADIEAGKITALEGDYPRELERLTANLNLLVANSGAQLERHRNALADLAHSLKTPLAVLRNEIEALPPDSDARRTLAEQIERMDRTVQYQLQRAAASGRTALTPSVPVAPVAARVRASLLKVYAGKALDFEINLSPELRFRGDEGDLTELLGNLLDNACKWATRRVRIRGHHSGGALTLEIEDDGPGLSAAALGALSARGARGDPSVPGQGIGLAVVEELVTRIYGGQLIADKSTLGGARIRISLGG